MPYVLRKTPDPENAHDFATITIEIPDDVDAEEFARIVGDFMKACSWPAETADEAVVTLTEESASD